MSTNSSSYRAERLDNPEESLFIALMKEEWDKVVEIFEQHTVMFQDKKMGNMMKATNERPNLRYDESWSDTALHWAITNGAPEDKVERLVSKIEKTGKALETLKVKNSRGDTPLHCAASRGSRAICSRITRVDKSLVRERNNEGETPLFSAALKGRQLIHEYLHSICHEVDPSLPSELWTRSNGDTILHCTIRRKEFDLSYRIVELYKDQQIGRFFNTDGHLPLNELVMIPSAFQKGILLIRWWQKLLHFISYRGKLRENHIFVARLMDELVKQDPWYLENKNAKDITDIVNMRLYPFMDSIIQGGRVKRSTALLIAAQNGLTEQVKKILHDIPVSIHDQLHEERKNIVHVAIEERQSNVLEEVKKHQRWKKLIEKVDAHGNNALHLAAKQSKYIASGIRGSVMQMQWEVMWFEYVKNSMPSYDFMSQRNEMNETPWDIFTKEHTELMKECNESVKDTCGSYIVAATLVTGSAFSACFQQDIDRFGQTFSISLLLSFLFSIASLTTFLAIYISRKEPPKGFRRSLPLKLCMGIISFLASLVSMLIAFYAALSYDFRPQEEYKPIISYGVILLPVALLYTFAQLPLYWHLFKVSIITKVPNPRIVEEESISRFFPDLRTEQEDHNLPNVRDDERPDRSS